MSDFRFFEFFDNILNLSRQEFFLIFLDHFYLLATFLGQRERWVPINHHWAGMGKMSLQTTHTCIGVCVCEQLMDSEAKIKLRQEISRLTAENMVCVDQLW